MRIKQNNQPKSSIQIFIYQEYTRYMIITQPNGENVALIAADELESLLETTHLLSSQKKCSTSFSCFRHC
jgi:hypothetical protein